MTRQEAEQVADSLRAAGWPSVTVAIDDNGEWRAVAEDFSVGDGGWYRRPRPPAGSRQGTYPASGLTFIGAEAFRPKRTGRD